MVQTNINQSGVFPRLQTSTVFKVTFFPSFQNSFEQGMKASPPRNQNVNPATGEQMCGNELNNFMWFLLEKFYFSKLFSCTLL